MARHKFEKGNCLGGRKPLSDDVKQVRNLSYEEMIQTVSKIRSLKKGEVQALDPGEMTLGEIVILEAYTKKDYKAIKDYEDRIWGKAKEQIEVTGDAANPLNFKIEVVPAILKEQSEN